MGAGEQFPDTGDAPANGGAPGEEQMPMDMNGGDMPMDNGGNEAPMDDANADMPMDDGIDGGKISTDNPKADYVVSLVSKLNGSDLKAAEGYIESLVRDNDAPEGMNEPMGDDMGANMGGDMGEGEPMMETIIFTKKQLSKINEELNNSNIEFERPIEKKHDKSVSKKSPFNSPKFK